MKKRAPYSLVVRILAVVLTALGLTLAATAQQTPGTHAITEDTTISFGATADRIAAGDSVDYQIDDSVTLTFSATSTGNTVSGLLYYLGTAGREGHFTATTSGATGNGLIVMNGNGSRAAPTTTSAAGLFYIGTGNSYVTVISGTRDNGSGLVTTGTIKDFWAASHGGVVYMKTGSNTLTLQNLHFLNNGASRANAIYGGVISAENTGVQNIYLHNVTFTANQIISSRTNNNGAAYGGALSASSAGAAGAWRMSDVTFDGNIALGETTSSGATHTALAHGGGVYQLNGTSNDVFSNIVFTNNTANALGNLAGATAHGGGLYLGASVMTFEKARFEGNTAIATTAGDAIAQGGAVHMTTDSQVLLTDALFASNTATATGATRAAFGGAIYQLAGITSVTSGTFAGNHADDAGGAIYITSGTYLTNAVTSHTNVVFTNNTAARGGALFLTGNAIANITLDSIARDMAYAGNAAADAASGGFAYMESSTLNFNIAADKTLAIGNADDSATDTIIGDAASAITINETAGNTGALVLHGNSAANAATISVAAGSLLLGNANAALGGNITIASGATVGGAGTLAPASGVFSIADNATLRVGYTHAGAQTLAITGALSLGANSILSYGIYGSDSADLLTVNSLARTGATTIDITAVRAGDYTLIRSAANLLATDIDNLLTTLNGYALNTRQTAAYSIVNNTDLVLTLATANTNLVWAGASGANWDIFDANWTVAGERFIGGDSVEFNTTANTSVNVTASVDTAGISVNNTGTLTLDGVGSITTTTADTSLGAPTGKLTKDGAGTLVLANTGTNTFAEGIDIVSGAIIGNADTLRTGASGSVAIGAGATLAFDQASGGAYENIITGAASSTLQKLGAGELALTADNSNFLGATKVSAGTLNVAGQLGGAVSVDTAGAHLTGSGTLLGGVSLDAAQASLGGNLTILGNVTTTAQSVITVGYTHGVPNSTGTLTIGGTLSLVNDTTIRIDIEDGSISDLLAVGALERTGTSTLDLSTVRTGTYKIISTTASTLAASATDNLALTNNGGSLTNRTTVDYKIDGNDLWLDVFTGNVAASKWSGSNTGVWAEGIDNWQTDDQRYVAGDSVIFDDTAAGSGAREVVLGSGAITVADMTVSTDGVYQFTGNSAITTSTVGTTLTGATGKLAIDGSGLVVFANTATNNFTGGIALNSGTLQGSSFSLNGGGIVNNSVLVFDQETGPGRYTSSITGTGSLVKTGLYPVTITGEVNYASGLTVLRGNLLLYDGSTTTKGDIDIASGGFLFVRNSSSYTVQNTLTGEGSFYIGLDSADAEVNFATTSGTVFAGSVVLEKGTFHLSGENTIALSNARLTSREDNTTIVGSGTQSIRALYLDGGLLVFSATAPADTIAAGIIEASTIIIDSGTVQVSIPESIPNPMPGANLFTQDDGAAVTQLISSAVATVSGSNLAIIDQTGASIGDATATAVGITQDGASVATGTYNYALTGSAAAGIGLYLNYQLVSLTIDDGATLNLAPDADVFEGADTTFSATISGNGNLSIAAPVGTVLPTPVTLAAENNFTGTTTVTSGSVIVGVSGALGADTNDLVIASHATVTFGTSAQQTLASVTSAAGSALDITSGTLSLSGGSLEGALNGAANGVLNVNAGNLELNAASTAFRSTVNVAPNAIVTLANAAALERGIVNLTDENATLVIAPVVNGASAVTITGNGSLLIAASTGTATIAGDSSDFTGATTINSNVIAAHAAAFGRTGTVTISAEKTLTYTANGAVSTPITGAGSVNVESTVGYLYFSASNDIPAINVLNGGYLVAAHAGALGTASTKIAVNNGTLVFGVNGINAASITLAGRGKLDFLSPDIHAAAQSVTAGGQDVILAFRTDLVAGAASSLTVTDPMSGVFGIAVVNHGSAPAVDSFTFDIINNTGGAATYYAKTEDITFADSMESFAVSVFNNGGNVSVGIRNSHSLSPVGRSVIANAGGSMPLTWFAELETIEKRMGDLRLGGRSSEKGFDLWARGSARRLDVNDKPTGVSFSEDHYGIDAGIDFRRILSNDTAIYVGVFTGYGNVSRDVDDAVGDGDTKSLHGGLYLTALMPSGWYFDVVGKYNSFENEFNVTDAGERVHAEYDTNAIGASFEVGKTIRFGDKWFVQPSAQFAFTRVDGAEYKTSSGIPVELRSTRTQQFRAGALAGYKITTATGNIFQPYAKAHVAQQNTSGGQIIAGNGHWTPTIDGARFDVGLGFNWMPVRGLQLYFDYEYAKAKDYTKPYGLTAGVRYQW